MNKNLEKIKEYLISTGVDEDINERFKNPIKLAMDICVYAHRNQTRENGENYAYHPFRCFYMYQDMVGFSANKYDKDLMHKHLIPYVGVMEVCLLHDVIEDTEFTIDDLEEIFSECGFKQLFNDIYKDALIRITHNKSVSYEDYIKIVMENPIASLVKMLDLQDNLRVLDLVELNEKNYRRSQDYLHYIYLINSKWEFVEHIAKYQLEVTSEDY